MHGIFCPTPGFKVRTFVSSGFSTSGDFNSASSVPHCGTDEWIFLWGVKIRFIVLITRNQRVHTIINKKKDKLENKVTISTS